jgi:tetratricopeptide (TPR) repeat protein
VNARDATRWESAIDDALTADDVDRAAELSARYRAAAVDWPNTEPASSPRFRAAYLSAQVFLVAGRLGEALEQLTPLLAVVSRLPAELAARVRLFLGEALARLHREGEARAQLSQVAPALLDQNPLLAMRALRIRLWLGEVGRLSADLAACARALERQGETTNLALLACEEGRAWDAAGCLERAEQCLRRAGQLRREPGQDAIRADILLQLGRLEHVRGRLAAALRHYDDALACAGRAPQRLETELRRLLVRLDLGAPEPVRADFARLLAGRPAESLPEEVRPLASMVRALLDGTAPADAAPELAGYLAAERGDTGAARAHYADALTRGDSPERRARAALALGLLATQHGATAEARGWLRQAEELGRTCELPEVLTRALQVSGQLAAEQDGNDDLARRLFEEAVLVAEVQAGQFHSPLDRATYRSQHGGVLRNLLRSACRRGDARAAFRYQELERGRLLLDLLQSTDAARVPLFRTEAFRQLQQELAQLEQELQALGDVPARTKLLRRQEELFLRRDRRLEEYLAERGRQGDAVLPALPDITDLQRVLPRHALYLAPVLTEDELFLLVAAREGEATVVAAGRRGAALCGQLHAWQGCLNGQLLRYQRGWLGRSDRAEMDEVLEGFGHGPLGESLARLLSAPSTPCRRLLWVPDGPLHALPVHALRRDRRYLIEDREVVWNFSGALLVHLTRSPGPRSRFRPALVVTESPAVLPEAEREGRGVAAAFWRSRCLRGQEADRSAVRAALGRAVVAHFACHATFDPERPLAACVRLPSGQPIHALEWLGEPIAGLRLATFSACRSGEVAPVVGRDVFGLVSGVLGGGARAVLAGLWPVADQEALPLMWHFYNRRLTEDLATALAQAQRAALAAPESSPLFWAAFALFGDGQALPAVCPWLRWAARWRQRRHARRFATDLGGPP